MNIIDTLLKLVPCNDHGAEAHYKETRAHLTALWAQTESFKPERRTAGVWAFDKGNS